MLSKKKRHQVPLPPEGFGLTGSLAFVKAQTRHFVRSMSCNSLRRVGFGFNISSNGKDPSHFASKSSGSCYESRLGNAGTDW